MSARAYCCRCDCSHGPGECLPRYAMRTRYHVWTIIDRDNGGRTVDSFGARGRGDTAAREAARARLAELNTEKEPA